MDSPTPGRGTAIAGFSGLVGGSADGPMTRNAARGHRSAIENFQSSVSFNRALGFRDVCLAGGLVGCPEFGRSFHGCINADFVT